MFESRTATHSPMGGRACLHHGTAVIAYAHDLPGNIVQSKAAALLGGPGGEGQHRKAAAQDAQKQVSFIGTLPISLNAFQKSTAFLTKWLPRAAFGEQTAKTRYTTIIQQGAFLCKMARIFHTL